MTLTLARDLQSSRQGGAPIIGFHTELAASILAVGCERAVDDSRIVMVDTVERNRLEMRAPI